MNIHRGYYTQWQHHRILRNYSVNSYSIVRTYIFYNVLDIILQARHLP